ncbi:MAG: biotin--[acetyl-CoA-carboxylase] ligase [Acidobacteriaceae bacterium]
MTATFDPDAVTHALAGTIFAGKLHYFPTIGSTNQRAMQEGAEGAPHGSVYVAEEQTAGRGRASHTWHSEAQAGLYVSILLRPQMAPADALWLSLAAGLAVQRAVKETTAFDADLRWPNDLLLGQRKFCGILTEMNAEATRVRYAVVGIGINVDHAQFPPELRDLATSLRIESGRTWPHQDLLIALLQAMHEEIAALLAPGGTAPASQSIRERLAAHSTWINGKAVRVDEAGGYTGVTAGLDARGFLLVRTADGLRTVLSGGVRGAKAP